MLFQCPVCRSRLLRCRACYRIRTARDLFRDWRGHWDEPHHNAKICRYLREPVSRSNQPWLSNKHFLDFGSSHPFVPSLSTASTTTDDPRKRPEFSINSSGTATRVGRRRSPGRPHIQSEARTPLSQHLRFPMAFASQRKSKDQLRGCVDAKASVDAAKTAVRVRGPTAP